jgi:hypothetical protein
VIIATIATIATRIVTAFSPMLTVASTIAHTIANISQHVVGRLRDHRGVGVVR